ncbi:hypothetical protein DM02DRAFT_481822, partial [Periconia macrospinosa]
MAEVSVENQYFDHLVEYQVAVCKQCRYAVWPNQIEGHLRDQHGIKRKEARLVQEGIRGWVGLMQHPSELRLLGRIAKPVAQLPL